MASKYQVDNFLTKRKMKVVVDGECSKEVSVDSGVPQGTVLGPLLFLCHINDLPDSVTSTVRLFADDCLLYRTIENYEDQRKLQKDLENLEEWAKTWGMKFNAKKCYIMSINKKNQKFYQLGGHILENVNSNPYLGLQISDDLKWSTHINKIASKASSTLGFLNRNIRFCPLECRKNAYLSLVRSQLDYGSTIYDPYLQQDINKLEKVQRRGVRFITQDYKSREEGCVTKMMKDLNFTSLEERRKQQRLNLFYKVKEGKITAMPPQNFIQTQPHRRRIVPTNFKDFEVSNIVKNQARKNSQCVKVPTANTAQYRHSFFVKTAIDWNNLDENIVNSADIDTFKNALQKHLD